MYTTIELYIQYIYYIKPIQISCFVKVMATVISAVKQKVGLTVKELKLILNPGLPKSNAGYSVLMMNVVAGRNIND